MFKVPVRNQQVNKAQWKNSKQFKTKQNAKIVHGIKFLVSKNQLVLMVLLLLYCLGTQRVISFLRQMLEHGGFYRKSDQMWITFERIQFVGACNPPTDPGRKPLSHRSGSNTTVLLKGS